MATMRVATLILVALVGCGPKPPAIIKPYESPPFSITLGSDATGNPYRFTEGEWGEGWPKSPCSMVGYDDGQIRMLIKNCDMLKDIKLKDYSLDNY